MCKPLHYGTTDRITQYNVPYPRRCHRQTQHQWDPSVHCLNYSLNKWMYISISYWLSLSLAKKNAFLCSLFNRNKICISAMARSPNNQWHCCCIMIYLLWPDWLRRILGLRGAMKFLGNPLMSWTSCMIHTEKYAGCVIFTILADLTGRSKGNLCLCIPPDNI